MSRIPKGREHAIAKSGLLLAVLSALAALASGFGSHYGLWDFRAGLNIFKWSAYCGVASAALSLLGIILSLLARTTRTFVVAVFGLIISAVVVAVPLHWLQKAKSLPAIHDITTDTENPPKFVAILPLRRDAPNPSDYGGEQVAAQQHKAYPDIAPLILAVQPGAAFEKAVEVVRSMGWKMVDADRTVGRIEATATTFWFGFKDDIVIRIDKSDDGSRVDIRSVSRVGRSDAGTNTDRIRKFLREMEKP